MKAAVERFARRWWRGGLGWAGEALSVASLPLSWGWSLAGAARRAHPTRVPGLTVVSVGNVAVGGTGKTPLAAWIAARIRDAGAPTAVLVGGHADDEAELHRRWRPDVPVLTGSNRLGSARRARAGGARAVVLDDGFQHRAIARDLDVVAMAAEDLFPGRLLPRGPYREAPDSLARADAVVVTRRVASADRAHAVAEAVAAFAPGAVRARLHIEACGWQRLDASPGRPSAGEPALAVCAVGRPTAFRTAVERLLGADVELMDFADHHAFGPADVSRIQARARGRPVVVTAKDAVKLAPFVGHLPAAYVLCDTLVWESGETELRELLDGIMTEAVSR